MKNLFTNLFVIIFYTIIVPTICFSFVKSHLHTKSYLEYMSDSPFLTAIIVFSSIFLLFSLINKDLQCEAKNQTEVKQ